MKRLSLFIYFFLITVLQAAAQQSFDKTAVKSVMKRVQPCTWVCWTGQS